MNAGRAELLEKMVEKLDASGLSWCCLRNAELIFKDNRSDVDLLILPEDIPLFETLLDEASREAGARLAQEASYLNFSRTYLTASGQWVRIDYEGEIRWRFFPVLSARKMLLRRTRREGIWVASPADEAVVLWIAALFRKGLSDRYRSRLKELDSTLRGDNLGRSIYGEAWGRFGTRFFMEQRKWLSAANLSPLWQRMKASLITRIFFHPRIALSFLSFLAYDVQRVVHRLFDPKGFYLAIESPDWSQADSLDLIWEFDRVFPTSKSLILENSAVMAGWQTWVKIRRTLFKGGLVLQTSKPGTPLALPWQGRVLHLRKELDQSWTAAGLPSGWMTERRANTRVEAAYGISIEFLTMLNLRSRPCRRFFCVLLGMDGSGKTTLARTLSRQIPQIPTLAQIRYFHFLPTFLRTREFPWPHQAPEPRKRQPRLRPSFSLGSILRLARNVARAKWLLWIQGRGFRGVLLGDRYLYNYVLDPASVRYFAPSWFVAWFLRLAPRPELLFILDTPLETILQRKQELSPEQIHTQNKILNQFPFSAERVVRLDGTRPPSELADQCLGEILLALEKK